MSEAKTVIANIDNILYEKLNKIKKQPSLIQLSGKNIGKRFIINLKETLIGRSSNCAIIVNDPSVSRNHAKIYIYDHMVSVSDLSSSNGLYVNDKKIEKSHNLNDKDILRFGNISMKFYVNDDFDMHIHDKIYKMATIDSGTKIFNKKYLLDSLDYAFESSKRSKTSLSVIYFDLDHFKKVNDNFGHAQGDYILKECAKLVKKYIRKIDIFGRYGGEEFVIILPNTNKDTAYNLAERIRKEIATHIFKIKKDKKNIDYKQTLSLGIAEIQEDQNQKDLLEKADQNLYKAKKNGRNMTIK